MHIDGARTIVEVDEELLHFANAENGAFQHFLDKDAFLRMHDLIVALFQPPVNLNVLDVQDGVVRPALFHTPQFRVLYVIKVGVRYIFKHGSIQIEAKNLPRYQVRSSPWWRAQA